MNTQHMGPPRGREERFELPGNEVKLLYELLQDPVIFAARENRLRSVGGELSLRLQGGEKRTVLDLQQTAQESVRVSMIDALDAHDAIGMIPYRVIPTEQRMIIFGANGLPLTDAETFDAFVQNRIPDSMLSLDGDNKPPEGEGYDSDGDYFGDALTEFQVAPSTVEEYHNLLERQSVRLRSYNRKIRRKQREDSSSSARTRKGASGMLSPYAEGTSAYSLHDVARAAMPYEDAAEWTSAWLEYARKASAESRMSARKRGPHEPSALLPHGHDPYAMASHPDGSGPRIDELHTGFRDGKTVRDHQMHGVGGNEDSAGPRRTETRRVSDLATSPVQTLDPRSGVFTMVISTDGTRRMEFKVDSVDTVFMVHVFDGCWPARATLSFVSPAARLMPNFMRFRQVLEASIQAHVFSSRPTVILGEKDKVSEGKIAEQADLILLHTSPESHAQIANANYEYQAAAVTSALQISNTMNDAGLTVMGKNGTEGGGSYSTGTGFVFHRLPDGSTVSNTVSNTVQVSWSEFHSTFVRSVSGEFKTPPSFLGEEKSGSRVDETERDRVINELGVEDARRIAGSFFTEIYRNAFGERDHMDAAAWLAACGMPRSHFDVEAYPNTGGADEDSRMAKKRPPHGNDMYLRGGDLPRLATPDELPDDVPLHIALENVGTKKGKGKTPVNQRRKLKGTRHAGAGAERSTDNPLEGVKKSAMMMLNGDMRASVIFPENPYQKRPEPVDIQLLYQLGAISTEDFYDLLRKSVGLTDAKFSENAKAEGVQSRAVALEVINGPPGPPAASAAASSTGTPKPNPKTKE